MPLSQALSSFRTTAGDSLALVSSIHVMDATGNYVWKLSDRELVTSASFLRLFIAWETFLEQAFSHFMLGATSISGNAPQRWVQPPSAEHAQKMLIGTQKYVDYANVEIVAKLAGITFGSPNPFVNTLRAVQNDLSDIRTVRNAAAHLSSTTTAILDALASRRLQRPVSNITVYDFILSDDPMATPRRKLLETFQSVLDTAAHQIAHF